MCLNWAVDSVMAWEEVGLKFRLGWGGGPVGHDGNLISFIKSEIWNIGSMNNIPIGYFDSKQTIR